MLTNKIWGKFPVCPIRIPDFGHTCLQKQLTKITLKTFGSQYANAKNKFIMINSLF